MNSVKSSKYVFECCKRFSQATPIISGISLAAGYIYLSLLKNNRAGEAFHRNDFPDYRRKSRSAALHASTAAYLLSLGCWVQARQLMQMSKTASSRLRRTSGIFFACASANLGLSYLKAGRKNYPRY